jgi:hypothetical protein
MRTRDQPHQRCAFKMELAQLLTERDWTASASKIGSRSWTGCCACPGDSITPALSNYGSASDGRRP